ncbi:TetR/AcrR family transcriptional regulator [Glutamicibacter arilaitensis]|uniref:TetR/AcrR family transcriptional regulator n=1 Tax=Glutamicibacter arilaitensis TaxID=256701 RepID=UPI00384ED8D4
MGIRDDRKAATKREIQAATLDLVESLGLEATTVARIAERVGISDRTFFRYFDSKESAIVPGLQKLIDALVAAELAPGSSAAEIFHALLEVCRGHFNLEVRHHEFRRISRLMLQDPKLLMIATRREQELVAALSQSLIERELLDMLQALLLAEMLATTWRVAWQCFAHEELAGLDSKPAELFEQAVLSLAEIASVSLPSGEQTP